MLEKFYRLATEYTKGRYGYVYFLFN